MKIRFVFAVLLFIVLDFQGYGQQDPQYTQYMYNMNIVNPAYAGSRGTLSINALGRIQWVSIEGAPKTITLGVNAPVAKNLGIGLSAISDKLGPVNEQNIYADFSYTLRTSEEGHLAFGLKGGVTLFDVGLLSIFLPQTFKGDDVAFQDNINKVFPNFGAGAYYYTDKFYVGLSMPNMLKSKHLEKEDGTFTSASEKMHVFFTSGYVFQVSENTKLKPSVMAKAVAGAPLSVDVSANALFNERLELGLNYRLDDSLGALVNFGVTDELRIGFAYDYTMSNLGKYNDGTYEVFVLWDIDFSSKNLKSPRFF